MKRAPSILKAIHRDIYQENFEYVTDIKQFGVAEDWRFPIDIEKVVDDCDGGAIACRVLVRKYTEYPSRLIFCKTETQESHLVCAVGDFILDNRFEAVATRKVLEYMGYKFLYMSGLEAGEEWTGIVQ